MTKDKLTVGHGLKSCPFCGGRGIMYDLNGSVIECDDCAGTPGWRATDQEAIDAWNTRTPDPAVAELVELVRDFDPDKFSLITPYHIDWMNKRDEILSRIPRKDN